MVAPGGAAPPAWSGCERIVVAAVSADLADELLDLWRRRVPVIIELRPDLGLDDPALPPPAMGPADAQPWDWPVDLRIVEDDLHHAIWANAVDGRAEAPVFRWTDEAIALGCRPSTAEDADVTLPDGTTAVCDGGPVDASLRSRLPASTVVLHRIGIEHRSLRPLAPADDIAFPLASDQLAAVTAASAGVRVIAPAGSGKTRVLTERARVLVRDWGLPPSALALVAYNVRAREELQDRLRDLAGIRIRTLNALSLRLAGDVQTIDERDVRNHLSKLVAVPRRAEADPLAPWLEALTRVRLGLLPPGEVEAEMPDVAGLDDVVRLYRAALAKRGHVDFDEQVVAAIARLLGDPGFRRNAQRSARVLLVDEFQDLTPAHLLLIRLLTGPAGAVFAVGDDDQTIYGYAGASPEWLVGFQRWFPGSAEHALEVNYRCAAPVVTAASNLLTRNRVRVTKAIRPNPSRSASDGALDVRPPSNDPAGVTASIIEELAREVPTRDIAVLCRVNALLAPVHVLLQHAGIGVRSPVDERFLARSTIRAALAWCSIAVAPPRSRVWHRLDDAARRPRRGMSENLRALAAKKSSVDDLRSLVDWLDGKGSVKDAAKISDLASDVELVRAAAASGTEAVLRVLRDDIGLATSAAALDAWSYGSVSSHEDDLDALVALAHLQPDPAAFEPWLREQLSRPPADDGVTLASVHAVKGREWPHVVVHHASQGLLPHRLVEDVEEERRVFHVAITRSSAATIVVPGAKPSPFLAELAQPGEPPARRSLASVARGATKPPSTQKAPPPQDDLPPEARALFDALRAWRTDAIRGTNRPAYTVLTDATLAQIARARPVDERALSRVPGIGPSKLEQYADAILAIVQAQSTA